MTPTLSPLTIAFLQSIRELHGHDPDGDGKGFEARLSHATDWLATHSYDETIRLFPKRYLGIERLHWRLAMGVAGLVAANSGLDPYLYDLIPGAAAERERALRGE